MSSFKKTPTCFYTPSKEIYLNISLNNELVIKTEEEKEFLEGKVQSSKVTFP